MLWNSGIEANKDLVRKYKRRLSFYSNIYIVKDPTRPENEGKVFLYKYGKKIFEKLNDLMNPQFEDENPVNPFDLWAGADFKLKIRNVEGYRNYDKSEFDSPAPLSDDDSLLENVWKSEHALNEFTTAENFKSYDELKTKLYRVLALGETAGTVASAPQPQPEAVAPSIPTTSADEDVPLSSDSDDDDTMSFFQKLAE